MAKRWSTEQWSQYWQQGTLTSFHGHFEGNYDGSIEAFWNQQFQQLPHGACLLDLGTGNGALALLAAKFSQEHKKSFQITGIDSARTRAQAPRGMPLTFIHECRMERTGLPKKHFDLVMSQFGFEYGQQDPTLREIRRLLKPGGCFAALIHHRDSAILEQAREALRHTQYCKNSNLLQTARQLAQLQARLARQGRLSLAEQHQAQTTHLNMRKHLAILQQHIEQAKDPIHLRLFQHTLMQLFSRKNAHQWTAEQRLQAIERLDAANHQYRLRMLDLTSAAYSEEDFKQLQKCLSKRKFRLALHQPLYYAQQFFCTAIVAYRDR